MGFALNAGCTVPEVNRKVRCGVDASQQQLLDDIHPARGCGHVQGAVLPAEVVLEESRRAVLLVAQPCSYMTPSAYDHQASLSLASQRQGHLPFLQANTSSRIVACTEQAAWGLAPWICCAPACRWRERQPLKRQLDPYLGVPARRKTAQPALRTGLRRPGQLPARPPRPGGRASLAPCWSGCPETPALTGGASLKRASWRTSSVPGEALHKHGGPPQHQQRFKAHPPARSVQQ